MLVLTRRPGESIVIGNGIKLTVVSIGPGRVKIGVEAPPSVRVDRAEIHERIMNEKASDVLEAVSATSLAGSADQPTVVSAGPGNDTGVLPNSATERPVPPEVNTPVPQAKLSDRLPRKPR